MGYKRIIDSSYPRKWDRWESDGVTWVIQDLRPEDDDRAIEIMMTHFLPDEVMSNCCGLTTDQESRNCLEKYWRECLLQRMSLGCYIVKNNEKTLAALNICIVKCEGDDVSTNSNGYAFKPAAWEKFSASFDYINRKLDSFKMFNTEKILYAMGLCVMRDHRGAKLGAKVLAAREPLCKSQGIIATTTVFTGIASQKLAAKVGFMTAVEVPFTELADNGMPFPRDDRVIKIMVKKFD